MTQIARHAGISASFLELARFTEKAAAYLQGKGYGSSSINQEVKLAHELLGHSARLAIDIGGNTGEYTAALRRRSANTEIHTFEPSSINIKKLNERFGTDPKITLVPFAVSDSDRSATLFSNQAGSHLGSLTKRKLNHFDVEETVTTLRFEDYWRNHLNSNHLDIVKIDIEGHELEALRGFGQAIGATSVFQFEFGGCNIDTRTCFQDFWYFFQDHAFDIYRITPIGLQQIPRYLEIDEFFSTTNFLAVQQQVIDPSASLSSDTWSYEAH